MRLGLVPALSFVPMLPSSDSASARSRRSELGPVRMAVVACRSARVNSPLASASAASRRRSAGPDVLGVVAGSRLEGGEQSQVLKLIAVCRCPDQMPVFQCLKPPCGHLTASR